MDWEENASPEEAAGRVDASDLSDKLKQAAKLLCETVTVPEGARLELSVAWSDAWAVIRVASVHSEEQ